MDDLNRSEHLFYDEIESYFRKSISSGSAFLFDDALFQRELACLWEQYDIPFETLLSFMRNVMLVHVKKVAPLVKRSIQKYLDAYKQGKSILELSVEANYPPYLFCRFIAEKVAVVGGNKKALTKIMKDPVTELRSIEAIAYEFHQSEKYQHQQGMTRLASEIKNVIDSDPMNGPNHERDRHLVGVEYEVLLETKLERLGIPFETESDLRDRGTSRTPDILLSIPIGVQIPSSASVEWKMVCWIDSKAMFGDVHTHKTSVLPQAESYVHRYGPGLILYWFGHAPSDRLDNLQGDIVIRGWDIPMSVMFPTGEVVVGNDAGPKQGK